MLTDLFILFGLPAIYVVLYVCWYHWRNPY